MPNAVRRSPFPRVSPFPGIVFKSAKDFFVIIDTHGHFVPASLLEALTAQKRLFPNVKTISENGGVRFAFSGQKPTRPASPGLVDLGKRKQWMGAQKIDHQVVGSWLDIFGYELPAAGRRRFGAASSMRI